jgi:N utilization substance protein A
LQRVRDAERDAVYSEFIDKEGRIVRGIVHRVEKRNVIVEIGKAEAVLMEREQIPGERYNPSDRIRAYVLEVKKGIKGPQILLSRTHPGFLVRLFETEIPEIAEGIVQVREAAREGGERAKVAVASTKRDVDPIGACVGLRGTRIQVISRELRGEKIDIVEWSPDPATFVARALSPAKVSSVTISEPDAEGGQPSVLVIVPDSQLSLAIGKRGQNARLAAKLTGLRVDIKSESEVEDERRREEEELAEGRLFLATVVDVTPSHVEALIAAGLVSPARIARADAAALAEVAGLDERKARTLLEAAEAWVLEHAVVVETEEAIVEDHELSAAENRPAGGDVVGDRQDPSSPTKAGE